MTTNIYNKQNDNIYFDVICKETVKSDNDK